MLELIRDIIVASATLGFLFALYIYLGTSRVRWVTVIEEMIPEPLRLSSKGFPLLSRLQSSHLFGISNALLAVIYYLLILITAISGSWVLLWISRWAAVMVLLMSAYLVYTLSFKLKRMCVLCYIVNILNGLLAAMLWNVPSL